MKAKQEGLVGCCPGKSASLSSRPSGSLQQLPHCTCFVPVALRVTQSMTMSSCNDPFISDAHWLALLMREHRQPWLSPCIAAVCLVCAWHVAGMSAKSGRLLMTCRMADCTHIFYRSHICLAYTSYSVTDVFWDNFLGWFLMLLHFQFCPKTNYRHFSRTWLWLAPVTEKWLISIQSVSFCSAGSPHCNWSYHSVYLHGFRSELRWIYLQIIVLTLSQRKCELWSPY